MTTNHGTLHLWDCTGTVGEPVCISTFSDDSGFSLNLYLDNEGEIQGIQVWKKLPKSGSLEPVAVIGEFPSQVFEDEFGEDYDVWIDAESFAREYKEHEGLEVAYA